jgi:dolichol-phosphate mannosyltransferase
MNFDILLPVHNEASTIKSFFDELESELKKDYFKNKNFNCNKVIVIEDGSVDDTSEIINQICKSNSIFELHQFRNKLGYVNALNLAISKSNAEYLIFCDTSGKYTLSDIQNLLSNLSECNFIIGKRKKFQDQFYREIIRIFLNFFVSLVFKKLIHDIDSPFRIIRREDLAEINKFDKVEKNLINLENTIIYLTRLNKNILEIPINYRKRPQGKSRGIPLKKVLNVSIGALRTIRFYWKY